MLNQPRIIICPPYQATQYRPYYFNNQPVNKTAFFNITKKAQIIFTAIYLPNNVNLKQTHFRTGQSSKPRKE
ncbi:hypothetical protein [Desulfuromonas acetoxidans]|uniref:hypothetical protein n=1 Tax=Desulfuromonas acetoxidans TaxID=891 RepID=UPI00292EB935|nr:hypothetical protein [Desulfuromonas acetoxidans]